MDKSQTIQLTVEGHELEYQCMEENDSQSTADHMQRQANSVSTAVAADDDDDTSAWSPNDSEADICNDAAATDGDGWLSGGVAGLLS